MSTIVKTSDSLIFGTQSPFFRIQNDNNIKSAFTRQIIDKSSAVARKRNWRMYCLSNEIFPRNTIEFNDNIRHAIGRLLDPFISTDMNIVKKSSDVSRQKYIQAEVTLTNELIKATGVKNTLVCIMDSDKEGFSSCRGIITYLTRDFTGEGRYSELEASWSNKFFTFSDPASLSMVVLIPKQYIESLIIHSLENYGSGDAFASKQLNSLALKGLVVENFVVDFIKSVFVAINNDGFRIRVNRDISNLNDLFQKEGFIISTNDINDVKQLDRLAQYTPILKKFKDAANAESLIYNMLTYVDWKQAAQINPLEFYKTFIDIPYAQMEEMFYKCPAFKAFTKNEERTGHYVFSNNLSEMDGFFKDQNRDVIVLGLKIIRYLPFLIFNTYVMGGGAMNGELKNVLNIAKKFTINLGSYSAGNAIAGPVVKFINENIEYMCGKFMTEMSSPINVTPDARKALTGAIGRFGITAEVEDIADI